MSGEAGGQLQLPPSSNAEVTLHCRWANWASPAQRTDTSCIPQHCQPCAFQEPCLPLAGEGSKEELAAAVQAHLAQEREHRERRAHARALLDGEGLGYVLDGYYAIPAIDGYIMTGW